MAEFSPGKPVYPSSSMARQALEGLSDNPGGFVGSGSGRAQLSRHEKLRDRRRRRRRNRRAKPCRWRQARAEFRLFGIAPLPDSVSTNGKLSEYHAAVGLAELRPLAGKRTAFRAAADRYRMMLRGLWAVGEGSTARPISPDVTPCSSAPEPRPFCASKENLSGNGVHFRRWYGLGLHRQSYIQAAMRRREGIAGPFLRSGPDCTDKKFRQTPA